MPVQPQAIKLKIKCLCITFLFKNIFIFSLFLLNHIFTDRIYLSLNFIFIDRIYLSLNFRGLKIEQDNYKKN